MIALKAEDRLPAIRAIALAAIVVCALACVIAPGRAYAVVVGPFDVEGPTGAYAWDGTKLSITGEGVTIAGMADASSPASPVSVQAGVTGVGIGSDVHISTLDVGRNTRFTVTGEGNSVSVWNSVNGDAIGGTGSIDLGDVQPPLDLYDSVHVTLAGTARGGILIVWDQATLSLVPTSVVVGGLSLAGGILDVQAIPLGEPVRVDALSLGYNTFEATVVAPFGATHMNQMVSYGTLFVNKDDIAVYEAGERVGTVLSDGSFDITATRQVVFDGFDGEVLETQTVPLFGAATAPEVTAPEGYRFIGWDKPFDYVIEDMAVAAQFEAVPQPPAPGPVTPGTGGVVVVPDSSSSAQASSARPLAATGDEFGLPIAGLAVGVVGAAVALCIAARRRGELKAGE